MATTLLAIESSCDDTSAAIIREGKILSNIVSSQHQHVLLGGVVPEIASRAHVEMILPVVEKALSDSQVTTSDLDAIAITSSPGLLGSLHVGVTFAKSMALALDIPLIEVNHMDAHIMANLIGEDKPTFPFLCLTVSGGHTQISIVHSPLDIEIIGRTIDDAAGEAFDKSGKLLGLPYPAGPEIDRWAQLGKPVYTFPKPQIVALDFSFSGLKTSFLYFLRDRLAEDPSFIEHKKADLCASLQHTITGILMQKLEKAATETGIKNIALAGGVAANSALRSLLKEKGAEHNWEIFIPAMQYCTDNAAMIGIQGYYKMHAGLYADQTLEASPK